jgi:hypothetical protein
MKTRRKKKVKQSGGKRSNAGRKPYKEGSQFNATICIRCTKEQKEALQRYVQEVGTSLSTWLRDLGLDNSANSDLVITNESL